MEHRLDKGVGWRRNTLAEYDHQQHRATHRGNEGEEEGEGGDEGGGWGRRDYITSCFT